ncbi:hypothetical protein KI387_021331, partial [Taxus chinensis]
IFRMMYEAKATIRSDPIVDFHIEPHTLSPINTNCSAFDQEDLPSTYESDNK